MPGSRLPSYEERQQKKSDDVRYRKAAARLSGGKVNPHSAVTVAVFDKVGFVEVIVEVPREEMEKESAN